MKKETHDKIEELEKRIDYLCNLILKSRQYADDDPETAAFQARKTAEAICQYIYLNEVGEPVHKGRPMMLDDLIKSLSKKGILPVKIEVMLGTIQIHGNKFGAHPQSEIMTFSSEEVKSCLFALASLTNWFFLDYLKGSLPDSLEGWVRSNVSKAEWKNESSRRNDTGISGQTDATQRHQIDERGIKSNDIFPARRNSFSRIWTTAIVLVVTVGVLGVGGFLFFKRPTSNPMKEGTSDSPISSDRIQATQSSTKKTEIESSGSLPERSIALNTSSTTVTRLPPSAAAPTTAIPPTASESPEPSQTTASVRPASETPGERSFPVEESKPASPEPSGIRSPKIAISIKVSADNTNETVMVNQFYNFLKKKHGNLILKQLTNQAFQEGFNGDTSQIDSSDSSALILGRLNATFSHKSALDQEIISCDLVFDFRTMDAGGNTVNADSYRIVGAGFSESDAVKNAMEKIASNHSDEIFTF